jgi:hypothetical protein
VKGGRNNNIERMCKQRPTLRGSFVWTYACERLRDC